MISFREDEGKYTNTQAINIAVHGATDSHFVILNLLDIMRLSPILSVTYWIYTKFCNLKLPILDLAVYWGYIKMTSIMAKIRKFFQLKTHKN